VELSDQYVITSNRESGFGRYDVMLKPKTDKDGIILEFKVQEEDEKEEKFLEDFSSFMLCWESDVWLVRFDFFPKFIIEFVAFSA